LATRVYWKDMDKGVRFAVATDYIFCFLCFITAIVLIKLMHMVYKKLGTKDLVISFMLFFLTLACVGNMIFFAEGIFYTTFEESDAEYERK
jgi:hypothetical protein